MNYNFYEPNKLHDDNHVVFCKYLNDLLHSFKKKVLVINLSLVNACAGQFHHLNNYLSGEVG